MEQHRTRVSYGQWCEIMAAGTCGGNNYPSEESSPTPRYGHANVFSGGFSASRRGVRRTV